MGPAESNSGDVLELEGVKRCSIAGIRAKHNFAAMSMYARVAPVSAELVQRETSCG